MKDTNTTSASAKTGLAWRKTVDGVQVQIPTAPLTTKRRWSRLPQQQQQHQQQQRDGTDMLLSRQTERLATSSSLESSSPTASGSRNRSLFFEHATATKTAAITSAPTTEWLQMSCKKCAATGPEGGARAFVMGPQPLSVVLCTNRLSTDASPKEQLAEMEEILTHELIHVYDVRALQLDLRDCENLAYSEVRAAAAAECRNSFSLLQGTCVRTKALMATQNLFPSTARKCLQRVFERAFADVRPFQTPTSSSNSSNNAGAGMGVTAAKQTPETESSS